MNVFKIFATMSLVDAISKPLAFIRKSLSDTDGAMNGLSGRLGRLATGFGKVALPAAMFLGGLAAMTNEAIAFESKMADVAKVVDFESPAALQQMSRDLQDLSLQIPIAAEGFADIVSAAAQSGVAKDDLIDFSVQAAKMGVAFDIAAGEASKTMADWRAGMGLTLTETYSLADAVNHLANNMNATASDISQVLNRAGAVGKAAGFIEQQLAALAATGLSAGASADIVGTGLNSMFATLTQGTAMSKDAANAFKTLGFDAAALGKSMQVDARGTIMSVMEAIAALPKENQLSVITSAFGQLSLKSIAPMVGNLDNLRLAFGLVGDAANFAGSMQGEYDARAATTENSLQLLKNSFNVLAITIGSLFLPVVDAAAKGVSRLVQVFISASCSPVGAFLIKLAAGIAAALVGVTGLAAAFAVLKPILIIVGGALSSVLWPVLAIAGAVALVALAWKNDFMGIATMATAFAAKVKLIFQGVLSIFKTLKDGKGELSADLAEKIEAAGLMGLVTTVSRIVYRVLNFFKGLAAGVRATVGPAFSRLGDAFRLVGSALQPLFGLLSRLAGGLGEAAGQTGTSPWQSWGQVIGELAGGVLSTFVDILGFSVAALTGLIRAVTAVCDWLNNLGTSFGDALFAAVNFVDGVIAKISSFASSIRGGIDDAVEAISEFSFIDAGKGLINSLADGVKDKAMGLINTVTGVTKQAEPNPDLTANGASFIDTFAAGIKSRAGALVATVQGVFSDVDNYLPHSDARLGPLANLTASGLAIPGTLAKGVAAGSPQLMNAADRMLGGLNLAPPYHEMPRPRLGGAEFAGGRLPDPGFSIQEGGETAGPFRSRFGSAAGQRNITLHIGRVELPNVVDADGFVAGLEAIIRERTEA